MVLQIQHTFSNNILRMLTLMYANWSISSGHYLTYARAGENWFKINDTVKAVSWQTVRRKKAYLLFNQHAFRMSILKSNIRLVTTF